MAEHPVPSNAFATLPFAVNTLYVVVSDASDWLAHPLAGPKVPRDRPVGTPRSLPRSSRGASGPRPGEPPGRTPAPLGDGLRLETGSIEFSGQRRWCGGAERWLYGPFRRGVTTFPCSPIAWLGSTAARELLRQPALRRAAPRRSPFGCRTPACPGCWPRGSSPSAGLSRAARLSRDPCGACAATRRPPAPWR